MPTTYTISVNGTLVLDRAVARVEPHVGSILVTGSGIDATTVDTDEIFDAEGGASLRLFAEEGATVEVTYADEGENQHPQEGRDPKAAVPAEASRGSSTAGLTGGLESRTVDELRKEAAAKDIKGRSSMDKDELIDALRAAE